MVISGPLKTLGSFISGVGWWGTLAAGQPTKAPAAGKRGASEKKGQRRHKIAPKMKQLMPDAPFQMYRCSVLPAYLSSENCSAHQVRTTGLVTSR
jgi:hypothetical protein